MCVRIHLSRSLKMRKAKATRSAETSCPDIFCGVVYGWKVVVAIAKGVHIMEVMHRYPKAWTVGSNISIILSTTRSCCIPGGYNHNVSNQDVFNAKEWICTAALTNMEMGKSCFKDKSTGADCETQTVGRVLRSQLRCPPVVQWVLRNQTTAAKKHRRPDASLNVRCDPSKFEILVITIL